MALSAGIGRDRARPGEWVENLALAALPTTAALGSLLPGFGAVMSSKAVPGIDGLFGFRVVALLLCVRVLLSRKKKLSNLRSGTAFQILVVLWSIAAPVGALSAKSSDLAARSSLGLFVGLFLAYALSSAKDSARTLRMVFAGWIMAFVVTATLGAREIVLGEHLPNYLTSTDVANVDLRLIASTFGNPNNYAAFLVTAFPFLVNLVLRSRARTIRSLGISLAAMTCLLMLYTGSRICIFALGLEILILALLGGTRFRKGLFGFAIIISLFLLVAGTGLAGSIAPGLPTKLDSATPSRIFDEATGGGSTSSGERRVNLYLDGLWMISDSGGLGVGPGNFEAVMSTADVPYDTGGVLSPHNAYLEIASQYGLLVFGAFLLWAGICFRICWRAARHGGPRARLWGMTAIAAFIGNCVSALASSSYLTGSTNWVFMATLFLVTVTIEREAIIENGP